MDEKLHVRTYELPATSAGAGRIVEARCVPYGVPTLVSDGPGTEPYMEVFAPGAFARAAKAPDRVAFKYRHGEALADWIGRGMSFEETDEGLSGAFRVIQSAFGDQALALVDEGIMRGVSVGFAVLGREKRTPEGHVLRDRCHLAEVSLVPVPAYDGAAITGRRSAPKPLAPGGVAMAEYEKRLAAQRERLRSLGIT